MFSALLCYLTFVEKKQRRLCKKLFVEASWRGSCSYSYLLCSQFVFLCKALSTWSSAVVLLQGLCHCRDGLGPGSACYMSVAEKWLCNCLWCLVQDEVTQTSLHRSICVSVQSSCLEWVIFDIILLSQYKLFSCPPAYPLHAPVRDGFIFSVFLSTCSHIGCKRFQWKQQQWLSICNSKMQNWKLRLETH